MRFCMITTFYPPYNFGGDGIFVQRLSHELARQGHTVEVIHCIDSYRLLAGGKPAREAEHHPRVTVHGLRSPYGALAPLLTHQTGRPLVNAARIREILARRFDVINFHNISLVGGPGILACGDALKLYTMHEYWLVCPTHVLFKSDGVACTHRGCLRCTLAHGRPPQVWRHTGKLRRALEHVDCFIAATRFVQEQHAELGLGPRSVVLPHFAPWPAEPQAPLPDPPPGLPSGEPGLRSSGVEPSRERAGGGYFLFVGRLERLKGLHTILPVLRRRPDLRLVIAGTGSDERSLRDLARESANVRFAGTVEGEALRRLYREAIALVVPSLCYEICPLVILEAFSQGTPVVARRIGSLPEIVEAGARGETFATAEEAEAVMDRLRNDLAYRNRLSRGCLESCRREYSLQTYVEKYLQIVSALGPR
ncbi:MAG: glycosyltransferase [Candidatus Eisenbacteria bacterium]